jgi:hypothetical protein
MPGRRSFGARDQRISAFGPILARLCDVARLPGAVLVDPDGEAVDYAGSREPFDLKVMAAEWCNAAQRARASGVRAFTEATELSVRASRRSFSIYGLDSGYSLVIELPRHCFAASRRAVGEALRCISDEAGLASPPGWALERWEGVEVSEGVGGTHRPTAVWRSGAWHPVEVLGRYASQDLQRRERAYRVRLGGGEEITLVRERLGLWFADFFSFGGSRNR